MPISQASRQAALDFLFPTTGATDHIAYSANGTSESAAVARTAIGATGWAAATAATPSVKGNSTQLVSAAATAAATITHVAVFSASTGGTQKADWQLVDSARALTIGDQITWPIGSLQFRVT